MGEFTKTAQLVRWWELDLMTDRLLSHCLWLTIMSLIAGSAMGSLVLIYSGMAGLIGRQFEDGGVLVGSGIILAGACWVLCRHSDDLIDRRA
jgi:hypothetical protein